MKIAFTGGGTAGHVTPNIALIERCQRDGHEVLYFGTADGIERELITPLGVPYHVIPSERLRRYFDWRNFLAPLRVLRGMLIAISMVRRHRPDVLFSKGGFVAFPVTFGAWLNRVPVILHESDLTPGLANRMAKPFARHVCVSFKESLGLLRGRPGQVIHTGAPIRRAVLEADPERAREAFGLDPARPMLFVTGGSMGARHINQVVRQALPQLLQRAQVVHLCGKGNLDDSLHDTPGYWQFEYLHGEFPDLMAAADLVVCRAGANTLVELIALNRPSLLIPLSPRTSRGDQDANARAFTRDGMAAMLDDDALSEGSLLTAVDAALAGAPAMREALRAEASGDSVAQIYDLIRAAASRS